jgi:glycosyltransferase involved in cell wall biosynthesis
MNILLISTWLPFPPDNGAKLRVYYLLRALNQQHRVTLASFAFGTSGQIDTAAWQACCADAQIVQRDPFQRSKWARATRFVSPVPIVTRPLPEMTSTIQRLLATTRFDAVIASTEVTAAYALQTPPATARILEEHNSMSRWMAERYRQARGMQQRWQSWSSWRKTIRYEARLFKKFDLCCMVSDQDRQASLQMLPGYHGPMEVVPNGVDCERNRPGLTAVVPHSLVFNGALTYSANYDAMKYFLTEIYPLVRQTVPDVTLTITGSTAGVNLSDLPLDASVRLSGYVDDVRPLVAGSTLCVVPLREGGGTRLKILEAMALGTPLVVTPKAAEGIEARANQHYLIADEPAVFAAAVVRLLQDPATREHLARQARQLVEERYDWNRIGQQFRSAIEETVQRRKARGATA